MAKKLERKWFPGCYGKKITLKPVDKWAEAHKGFAPYFDTWEEAHLWLLKRAEERLDSAIRELPRAHKHLSGVLGMKAPA